MAATTQDALAIDGGTLVAAEPNYTPDTCLRTTDLMSRVVMVGLSPW